MLMKKSIYFLLFVGCSLVAWTQDMSVYLIGDAGEPQPQDQNLAYLGEKIANASPDDVLIFLGDNLYPKGLPNPEDPDRAKMEAKLNPQLDLIKSFNGRSFMIPGNHDWAQGRAQGWQNVRNMAKYVAEYTGRPDIFLPRNGCPGPVEIPLNDKVTLIILDTQYFLHSEEKARDEDGCEARGGSDALALLHDMVLRNADKHILVAAHHPMYSYGPHGGKFKFWKTNLFPLTEAKSMKNLYIPLPGLGTVYWAARAGIGNIQDIPNPKYKFMRNVLVDAIEKADNVVWANGHEHSLQYIKRGKSHYVVSGSGSKTSHVTSGQGTQFFQQVRGFAQLTYQDEGDVNLKYWGGDTQELLYEEDIYSKQVVTDEMELSNRPSFSGLVKTTSASSKYGISKRGRSWLGKNYRDTWAVPIEVPYFDILEEHGGLEIVKRGGGRQTTSLRLEEGNGRQHVLRSVEKDPSQLLPTSLRRTFAADFLQDQISSSHPYGALAVPKMADAVGVYHANPKLVFIPEDPAFGKYQYTVDNTMMLYEERPNDENASEPFFGGGEDVKGTLDMLEAEIYDDNDNWVDQDFVLRSRLFDMVIGDWDRHDDQWRWVGVDNPDRKGRRYRPIPRDRDQAFFTTDGFLPKIAASKWAVPSSEGFNEEMKWAPGFNWNMRFFDRTFVSEPEWSDWQREIDYIQENLTDEIIDEAIQDLPQPAYDLRGEEIKRILKARRDGMEKYARQLYEFLTKEVEVVGTHKHEYFLVERISDDETRVTVTKREKDGDLKQVYYQRTFQHKDTKEIRLYGLGGEDVFDVQGDVNKGLKVRIIGGEHEDVITDASSVRGLGKKTVVYDNVSNTELTKSSTTRSKLSKKSDVNEYDRKSYVYDKVYPLISAQFNPDNGLYLGLGFLSIDYAWRKKPFRSQNLFLANGALGIDSYNFRYEGWFTDVFGKWGLRISAEFQEPFFVTNFFGYGNETTFDFTGNESGFTEEPIDYYRVQTDRGLLRPNLERSLGDNVKFRFGPVIALGEVSRIQSDRFLSTPESGVDPAKVNEQHIYLGANAGFTFDVRDHRGLPSSGVFFNADIERVWGMNERSENLTRVKSDFSHYLSLRFPARLVIANRVGVEHIFKNDFEFFNSAKLGGWTNLRGFRRTRFHGQTAFFHNLDLRLKLFTFTTYVFPGEFGVVGFQDIGRVWYDGESSSKWHIGRGVGPYIAPLDVLAINFYWTFTEEEDLFSVRFGFFF